MKKWSEPHFRLVYAAAAGLTISGLYFVNILFFLTACMAVVVVFLHVKYRRSIKILIKKWLKFNFFTLLIWLTLSWKISDSGIAWNMQGITLAQLISLRANLILLTTWSLLFNVSDTVLLQAIGKLPLPGKLIHLFVLTVRYIALLGELNQRMEIAMKARGYRPQCNRRTLKIISQRVALLLIHAMVRTENAQVALKARGFKFGHKQ